MKFVLYFLSLFIRNQLTYARKLAIDLTCDSSPFSPYTTTDQKMYQVHSGMLRLARQMAKPGSPLHCAVHDALAANDGYALKICGHSLGAGVGALIGMLWTNVETCETVELAGLPKGRRVKVWAFACPFVPLLLCSGFKTLMHAYSSLPPDKDASPRFLCRSCPES